MTTANTASNTPGWTAYVQSHPMIEIKAPELAHTRPTPPPSYSTTPLPSYQSREIQDSASIWSGTTLDGSDIEATHPTSTHRDRVSARPGRRWRTTFWVIVILIILAYALTIGTYVGLCSRTNNFDKCMSSGAGDYSTVYTRQIHSLIKRGNHPAKRDRFTWFFGGITFGFIGFALIVGLTWTWVMERMRHGPRKSTGVRVCV
jgi:hypothetical protein